MPRPSGWTSRSQSNVAVGSTTLTITKPTGVVDNDILVMMLSHRGADYAVMPAGWTPIGQGYEPASGLRGEMFWRRASAEGANYAITGLADSACGFITAYDGGLLIGNVVNASAVRANVVPASGTPAITTTVPYTLLVMGVAITGPTATAIGYTVGQGPNGFWESEPDSVSCFIRQSGGTTNGLDCAVALYDAIKVVAGSTINEFRCTSIKNNVSIVAALIPETAAVTPGTKYYLTSRTMPAVREPWDTSGTWAYTVEGAANSDLHPSFLLAQQKGGGGKTMAPYVITNRQPNFDILFARWVTPPLAAQTLTGTFDLVLAAGMSYMSKSGYQNVADGRIKVHISVSVGQTTEVRSVLLDNYVDVTEIPRGTTWNWIGLTAPQSIAGTIQAGDSVVVELGFRVVSAPAPTLPLMWPPDEYSEFRTMLYGTTDARQGQTTSTAGVPMPDAVKGGFNSGQYPMSVPHLIFTDTFTELAPGPAPLNVTPAAAIIIPSELPYADVPYDTTNAASNARRVWYRWTAARTGKVMVTDFGGWGRNWFRVYTGGPAYADLVRVTPFNFAAYAISHRSMSMGSFDAVEGTTYYISVQTSPRAGYDGHSCGGAMRLNLFFIEEPQVDDLYLPATLFTVWRDGQCVNSSYNTLQSIPQGCAFDYTKRPMRHWGRAGAEEGTIHDDYRVLLSLFAYDEVRILDHRTIGHGEDSIDYISEPFVILVQAGPDAYTINFACLQITRDGKLYQQTYGNGFTYVCAAVYSTGGMAAFLDEPTDWGDEYSAVRGTDTTHGDSQDDYPFPQASILKAVPQITAAWAGALDEESGVLYYASGGDYHYSGLARTVKRFNVFTNTQMTDFATLPANGYQPTIKGMCVLPPERAGGLLVCNGGVVQRLNSTGELTQTYTPITAYKTMLCDVHITHDATKLWALDEMNTQLFQFDLRTGKQLQVVDTGQGIGNARQFALFQPDGIVPTKEPTRQLVSYPIRRLRQSAYISSENNDLLHDWFELHCQVGIGLTEGQGVDPMIFLSWSDDGGRRWSNEYPLSVGRLGNYGRAQARWRKLGMSGQKGRLYRVVVSDPVDWALIDAYLGLRKGR